MSEFSPLMTLHEAQAKLRTLVEEGHECPCCTQFAKVYKRRLIATCGRGMIALYREAGQDWAHLPTVVKKRMPDVAHQGGYVNLTAHWGLMQEERSVKREDGGRAGYWRLTDLGRDWVLGRVRVPKYAVMYDGRCLRLTGEPFSIQDSLGTKFDYREQMGW